MFDMTGASGNVGMALDAGATESDIKLTVYNLPTTLKLTLTPNGTEKIFYDDTDCDTVTFEYAETEQWIELCWNGTKWIVNDGSGVLSGTFNGALTFTGPITPLGGIVGDMTGTSHAATTLGEMNFTGSTPRVVTYGRTYSARATTALTAAYAAVVKVTVDKGVYLVTANIQAGSTTVGAYSFYGAVDTTQITTAFETDMAASSTVTSSVTFPVIVTAVSTDLSLYAKQLGGTSAYTAYEIWAVRIA